MRERAAGLLVSLYGRAADSGMFDRPVPRRLFESAYLAYKQTIEAGPVSRLRRVVPPGAVVVDVGANIGFFTLRFARWVGPGGRVIAIEPEARNAVSLRRRVARAGVQDVVECVQAAAADRAGELRLAVNRAHPGDHHIATDGEAVPAVTLDDLLAAEQREVALLKIDVQGAEPIVLAGAQQTIAAHRPAIFMEVDGAALARQGSSAGELVGLLEGLGYRGHLLTRDGIGGPVLGSDLARRSEQSYIDVLFLAG